MAPRPTARAFLVVLLVSAAVLAACGSAGPSDLIRIGRPATLVGTAWRAVTINGRAPVVGREPTVLFAAARVTGTGGCNQYGGGYAYDSASGRIQFAQLAMTAMGCEAPINDIESAFGQALSASEGASIDETGRLVLSGPASQIVLRVDAQPAARG